MEERVRWFLGLAKNAGGYAFPMTGTPTDVPLPKNMNENDMFVGESYARLAWECQRQGLPRPNYWPPHLRRTAMRQYRAKWLAETAVALCLARNDLKTLSSMLCNDLFILLSGKKTRRNF
jgi:hypothetical protein